MLTGLYPSDNGGKYVFFKKEDPISLMGVRESEVRRVVKGR
jgi:hypothetical protein